MSEVPEVSILAPGERSRVRPGGAVGSVQEAQIRVPREMLERTWSADNLELLARAYWAFLRRMSLGVIRVLYAPTSRTVAAFGKIPLLRFGAPIYEAESGRGRVTWPIERGLLVAREGRGRGSLRVSIERCDRDGIDDAVDAAVDTVRLIARVEVENFYPGIRGRGRFSRFGAWLYAQTQLRIHVLVCNAFLRSIRDSTSRRSTGPTMPSDRAAVVAAAMSAAGRRRAGPTYLIAGATGVIGRRLVAALRRDGVAVRALARDLDRGRRILGPEVELFVADLDAALRTSPRRWTVSSRRLLPRPHARQRPRLRRVARCRRRAFAKAATAAGVERVVYLGGLGPDRGGSPHLDSRHDTAEALRRWARR